MTRPEKFALATLILALPLMLMKLPWFLPTIQSYCTLTQELQVDGSSSYILSKKEAFERTTNALFLYGAGILAILGLLSTVFGFCKSHMFLRFSFVCAITVGIGLPIFEIPRLIDPSSMNSYSLLVIYLPITIAITALTGLIFSLRSITPLPKTTS